VLALAPGSAVGIGEIRSVIRKNGFTPKDATVHIAGRLVRTDGGLSLVVGPSRSYQLSPDASAGATWEALQRLPVGAQVELTGRVPESQDSTLHVTGMPAGGKPGSSEKIGVRDGFSLIFSLDRTAGPENPSLTSIFHCLPRRVFSIICRHGGSSGNFFLTRL
jgi:hypothetical protein